MRDYAEVNIDVHKISASVTPALGITIVHLLKNLFMESSGSIEPADLFGIADQLRGSGEMNFKAALDSFMKRAASSSQSDVPSSGQHHPPPLFGVETQLGVSFTFPDVVVCAGYDPVANCHVVPLSKTQLTHPYVLAMEEAALASGGTGVGGGGGFGNTGGINRHKRYASNSSAVDFMLGYHDELDRRACTYLHAPIRSTSMSCIDPKTSLPASAIPFIGATTSEAMLTCNIQPGASNIQLTITPLTISLPSVAPSMARFVCPLGHHHQNQQQLHQQPSMNSQAFDQTVSSTSSRNSSGVPHTILPVMHPRVAVVQRFSPEAFICLGAVTFGRTRKNGNAPISVSYAGTTSLSIPDGITAHLDNLLQHLPALALLGECAVFQATKAKDVVLQAAVQRAKEISSLAAFNPESSPCFEADFQRLIRASGIDAIVFPMKTSSSPSSSSQRSSRGKHNLHTSSFNSTSNNGT